MTNNLTVLLYKDGSYGQHHADYCELGKGVVGHTIKPTGMQLQHATVFTADMRNSADYLKALSNGFTEVVVHTKSTIVIGAQQCLRLVK